MGTYYIISAFCIHDYVSRCNLMSMIFSYYESLTLSQIAAAAGTGCSSSSASSTTGRLLVSLFPSVALVPLSVRQ